MTGGGLNTPGFTPYKPPDAPPPGTYDPALDSNLRAAQRGAFDATQDTEKDNQRASSGLETSRARIGQDKGFRLADLLRGHQRNVQDIYKARGREQADYGTQIGGLRRQFQQQGANQAQAATAQGSADAGTLRAALAARNANQTIARQPLDTSHQRFAQDSAQQQQRLGQDYTQDVARTNITADRQLGDLGTNYQYGVDDRTGALDRTNRELGFFTQDTGAQRFFQAADSQRYIPPGRGEPGGQPSNEFSDAKGAYRLILKGGKKYRLRPNGTRELAGRR